MQFYKVNTMIGHQGCAKHVITSFYMFANNITDAMDMVRKMPAVKHDHSFPFNSVLSIDEREYVLNIIKNAYYDCFTSGKKDAEEYNKLDKVAKIIRPILGEFKTKEGKQLANLCYKYLHATDDNTRIKLCRQYRKWIDNLENTDNFNV